MEKVSLNSQFYFLKNAMKILLPVSVFSLVFTRSYSLLPSLLHSFHEYSSCFSIQLFTYSSERNYIFLLCNGILVFIIKNSFGNISEYPKESHKEKFRESHNNPDALETKAETVVETENKVEEEQIETMSQDNLVTVGTVDENEDEAYQESYAEIIEELEDDDEEEELEETLEELNKKCDDFIMKIKKEIKGKN
ncbi:uncharacterized protein LOC132038436 [Lycium ferocissimum]|uniref:uncharacterized protein LOC132038436 n=1 Tax=Lycium ferocissimum TaxID=112874 RepID=UPI002814EE5C|nr:uncharacterized protein LOC132038436 [Lycium ferocissimum]